MRIRFARVGRNVGLRKLEQLVRIVECAILERAPTT
jgi:hypothetical protein